MEGKELDNKEIISLMQVYLNELTFRDNLLWSQTYKFFFATITVILLPYFKNNLDISTANFPNWIFNLIGIGMSVFFLIVSLSFAKRLKASSDTYNNIIKELNPKYQRVSILEPNQKNATSISYIIIPILFGSLLVINVMLLIFTKI
jgi:hypothetical protein